MIVVRFFNENTDLGIKKYANPSEFFNELKAFLKEEGAKFTVEIRVPRSSESAKI